MACKTYCMRPTGRCLRMSSTLKGLAQGLQRATVTRSLAAGPDRFEGRSRYDSFFSSERPSDMLAAEEGPKVMIFMGPVQFRKSFSLRTLLSAPLRSPCWIVTTVLYTQTHPPSAYMKRRRRASERVNFHPFTRATVRAYCSRTSS